MPLLNATSIPYTGVPAVSTPPDAGGQTQRIQADTSMFGALQGAATSQLGQTLERSGDQFAQIAIQRQQIFNETAATEASNNAQKAMANILYGDPNVPGDTGFNGKAGRDAMDAFPSARDRLNYYVEEARSKLQNPQQQLMFDRATRREQSYALSGMGRHYDSQMKEWQVSNVKAKGVLADNAMSRAAATGDWTAFNDSVRQDMEVGLEGLRIGGNVSPENIAAVQAQARARGVKKWTEGLSVTDPEGARVFLNNNEDALLGDEFKRLHTEIDRLAEIKRSEGYKKGIVPNYGPTGQPISGPIVPALENEAKSQGADVDMVKTIASLESSMGTNLGSRGNIFQLGRTEWANSGGGPMGDTATQIRNGVTFIKQTEKDLTAALGRKPTPPEIYLAHQQGVAGAVALMSNPDKPAGSVVPRENISANGGNPDAPASQFIAKWRQNYERASGAAKPVEPPKTPEVPVVSTKVSGIPTNLRAVGDSLAVQLVNSDVAGAIDKPSTVAGQPIIPGMSAGGNDQPDRIYARMKGLPDDFYKGNVVFLTSGSNMPSKISYVQDQIALAREKGAEAVLVPALGPGIKGHTYANQVLRYFAAEKGGIFFEPNIEWDKEGVHPKNATEVAKFRQQGLDALAAAKGPPT